MLDKNAYAGGHTTTHIRDGYVFDEGPHVSFTKNERIKKFFAEAINNEYLSIDAYIDNYWRGQYIRHPVITNMHGMPRDVVVKCITDYVEAKQNPNPTINNYEDWLVASYGRTYAETVSDAVRIEVPHHPGLQPQHGMGRPAAVPGAAV